MMHQRIGGLNYIVNDIAPQLSEVDLAQKRGPGRYNTKSPDDAAQEMMPAHRVVGGEDAHRPRLD